ncbi:permease [Terrisporobacter sp.]
MKKNIYFYLKRYKLFLIMTALLIIIGYFKHDIGLNAFNSAKDSFLQMLSVLPPIMVLLGLMDEWISRESMMKYMGDNSGIMGIAISIAFAAFAAGPMYAAFPFTAVLLKKGVKFTNVIIFMNAWCVIKISTLLFEISSLGYKFAFYRLIINFVGVIVMGYLVNYFVMKTGEDDILLSYKE